MTTESSATYGTLVSLGSLSAPSTSGNTSGLFIRPYTTVSIRTHVPIILEMKSSNFGKWSSFFCSLCG